jgi:hypothetical protein
MEWGFFVLQLALVAGSGSTFEDFGTHVLKGVPDAWQLYRVAY